MVCDPIAIARGRWGIDAIEYRHLEELGYGIDSSIPGGIDFRDRYGRQAPGPDFRSHFLPGGLKPYGVGKLIEIPVSILPVGSFGSGEFACLVARYAANRSRPISLPVTLSKALEISGLQRVIWLRPLKHPRQLLMQAARTLLERRVGIVNIMFHSSEAFVNTSPLSRTAEDVERLYGDLRAIVEILMENGDYEPSTLSDAVPNPAVARPREFSNP